MRPGDETEWLGRFGHAAAMAVPDLPAYAETLGHWLVTAPGQSPAWSQYLLLCIRLRDGHPGFPDPHHDFEGTTHELIVAALRPAEQPYEPETFPQYALDHGLPWLTPLNVRLQFVATDDEMSRVLSFGAMGIVRAGILPAEPPLSGSGNGIWLPSMVKTLAHIRGEAHAR